MNQKPLQYSLTSGDQEISFSVVRSRRKSFGLEVSPDRSVLVRAPLRASKASILEVAQSKARWIERKLAELDESQLLPTPRKYANGEMLLYLGEPYQLKILAGKPRPAHLWGQYLYVWASQEDDTTRIRQSVKEWYQERAQENLGRYVDEALVIAAHHDVPKPKRITIRDMKTRWGSCSPSGRLTLNLKLVQVPVDCIEYVIMHELCHLMRHDHGKSYYALLTRCMPDWRGRKDALDRYCLVE
jgi:predicted metal-dependent hydrolase